MSTNNDELLELSLAANSALKFDSPLEPGSDKMVELNAARGSFREDRLLWELHIANDELQEFNDPLYMLFGGHRGCGKSTELKRLAKELYNPKRYYVVFVDALAELDMNNIRYSDILLAQAKVLFRQLEASGIQLDQVFLSKLEAWFDVRIAKHESLQSFTAEIKTGIEAKHGLPFLGGLFAKLTASAKDNTTHREELRTVIRNSFSEFADAYNALIIHVEDKLKQANAGRQLLFVIDGTDRLRGEDADHFFVDDVHQLKQIQSNFIYCAPIDMLSESGVVRQHFSIVRLPMIKLAEKGTTEAKPEVLKQLRELVYRRMDRRLFDGEDTLDYLIWHSGGHLRDLIRLMHLSLSETMGKKKINMEIASEAIKQLSSDYRRLILQDDYKLLVEIDQHGSDYTPTSDTTRKLLYDLVLLEYNSYWWQSHPVVRTLPAYQQVK